MERGRVDAEMTIRLAKLAGFDLTRTRAEILAPQLAWVLEQASQIEALNRQSVEPLNFFQPSAWMASEYKNKQP